MELRIFAYILAKIEQEHKESLSEHKESLSKHKALVEKVCGDDLVGYYMMDRREKFQD